MFVLGANGAVGGYNLKRSVRLRSSATADFRRTPASTTNQRTLTFSTWVKRGRLGVGQGLFNAGSYGVTYGSFTTFGFDAADTMSIAQGSFGISTDFTITTTAVFRDPSAWYHIVFQIDTTQATAANRFRLYVNNVAIALSGQPAQNTLTNYNAAHIHTIGSSNGNGPFDGFIAETYLIDGQALDPTSFGEYDTITGVWKPKAYTGTYGTNGADLNFEDNSGATATTIGKDSSGNGNNWTPNNISVTAGVTYDSMTDVPTLTSATAANYAVLNPLDKQANFSTTQGNLASTINAQVALQRATIAMPSSGKFYFEMATNMTPDNNNAVGYGLCTGSRSLTASIGQTGDLMAYLIASVLLINGASNVSAGSPPAANVPMRFAADVTNGKFWIGNATVWYNSTGGTTGDPATGANPTFTTSLVGLFPCIYSDNTSNATLYANFGQRPFSYTPPTGFIALNTFNLPTATILKGNTVMDATLWTGDGLNNRVVANTGAMQPDLVWVKNRTNAYDNVLVDSVRGYASSLSSNSTQNESFFGQLFDSATIGGTSYNGFYSNGFIVNGNFRVNNNADALVAWQWQAGQGTTSSNTNGTITSTVSVNATAGFSVVTYTGNLTAAGNSTIGHGLGVAPALIISKRRDGTSPWIVQHKSLGADDYIELNTTSAAQDSLSIGAGSLPKPSSTVFYGSWLSGLNVNGQTHVAYCFAEIDGYSKFGSFVTNGSADNAFVYCGFRPKFLLFKRTDAAENWTMWDTSRNTFNVTNSYLVPNAADAEATAANVDLLSNGFKLRAAYSSGATYIFMAFAENPFKNSLAR